MVSIKNKSKQRVGDLVKAGNVLGEEGFFLKGQCYRETAECHSKEAGILEVDALALGELGSTDFKGKAHNRLAFQRDFKALFSLLEKIHRTKEEWRERAIGMLKQKQANAGEEYTEYFTKNGKGNN